MTGREHAEKLWSNIRDLGPRRLAALALVGLAVFLAVGIGAYYLGRPEMEALYTGLSREDVTRIGSALRDAGIPFNVSADGTTVLVSYGNTAQARMLLAEKGLPQSPNSGYELFNELGSLGLTSFMQEVTRVRALEGELARTIQAMKGVKAARVHIVLPDRGSFRREQQPASASVVIRTENADDTTTAQAIRHLVASAVPGMTVDRVTVLNTDGTLLLSGDDSSSAPAGRMASLEKTVQREIQDNVRRALTPYLGLDNFEISVAVQLNTDKKSVSETIYDPESRVERSVRVVKENEVSQNRNNQTPTTVQQNLPQQQVQSNGGENSSQDNQRREELTNYEISTRTIQTVSDGFSIQNLSIAVVVNRARLAAVAGDKSAGKSVDAQLSDIEQLVASAAGASQSRGDHVKVSAVDFTDDGRHLEPVPSLSLTELLVRQTGNVLNAATFLIVALLLIWFGLRPAITAILSRPIDDLVPEAAALLGGSEEAAALLDSPDQPQLAVRNDANLIEDLTSRMGRTTQRRLEQIVEFDEERAASILRQWLEQEERA